MRVSNNSITTRLLQQVQESRASLAKVQEQTGSGQKVNRPSDDPAATGLKQDYKYDGSRDTWKPVPHTQFNDGPIGVDDGVRRTLEMVVAAVIP